ncbi:unnamed protein product [Heterosigma akashiwo]
MWACLPVCTLQLSYPSAPWMVPMPLGAPTTKGEKRRTQKPLIPTYIPVHTVAHTLLKHWFVGRGAGVGHLSEHARPQLLCPPEHASVCVAAREVQLHKICSGDGRGVRPHAGPVRGRAVRRGRDVRGRGRRRRPAELQPPGPAGHRSPDFNWTISAGIFPLHFCNFERKPGQSYGWELWVETKFQCHQSEHARRNCFDELCSNSGVVHCFYDRMLVRLPDHVFSAPSRILQGPGDAAGGLVRARPPPAALARARRAAGPAVCRGDGLHRRHAGALGAEHVHGRPATALTIASLCRPGCWLLGGWMGRAHDCGSA